MTDMFLFRCSRPARLRAAALGCGLALVAPAAALAAGPAPAPAPASISVSGGWFRYLLAQIPAGGFMTLHNAGDAPAVLTGASSPACGSLMLHETKSGGGTDRMVEVRRVTVPAHGTLRFAPGGYHLMCMQPRMHTKEAVPVTLTFHDGRRITASFTVFGANGAPQPAMKPDGGMGKMRM